MLMVIISLFAVSLILASLLQATFQQQRQLQHLRNRHQAEWLADAGLQWAQRLSADNAQPAPSGWTWTNSPAEVAVVEGPPEKAVPAATMPLVGHVQLSILPSSTEETVQVLAVYPQATVFTIQTRREWQQPNRVESPEIAPQPASALQPENRE